MGKARMQIGTKNNDERRTMHHDSASRNADKITYRSPAHLHGNAQIRGRRWVLCTSARLNTTPSSWQPRTASRTLEGGTQSRVSYAAAVAPPGSIGRCWVACFSTDGRSLPSRCITVLLPNQPGLTAAATNHRFREHVDTALWCISHKKQSPATCAFICTFLWIHPLHLQLRTLFCAKANQRGPCN